MAYPYDAPTNAAIADLAATTSARFTTPRNAHVTEFPDALTQVATVAVSIADAAAAAAGAAANAASLIGTSTTSFTPAIGSQAVTTQSGKSWNVGTILVLASAANPTTNYGHGTVTAYSGTTLTLTFDKIGASPLAATDWNISLTGSVGAAGSNGSNGSTGATGPDGVAGFKYTYNTATSGDPGSGKFRFDNATFASATKVAFSETDANSNALATFLATIDDGTGTNKARVDIVKNDKSAIFSFYITSTLTDQGTYDEYNITPIVKVGSPSNADTFYASFFEIVKGDVGSTGSTGSTGATGASGGGISIPYTFSTTTTNSDPGNGTLRLGTATQNTSTAIRADLLDSNGADWTTVIDALDDSTNTIKGQVRLFKTSDNTKFIEGNVTAVDSSVGYRNITFAVTASSAANPFANADAITLTYTRAGDAGSAGSGTGDVVHEGAATSTGTMVVWGADNQHIKGHASGAPGALAFKATIDSASLLDANVVTLAKLATQADQTFLGNTSGGAAVPSALSVSAVKSALALDLVDNTSDATKNAATATLTNKRITPRRGNTTSSATPTINTDNVDIYSLTAQAAAITSFTTNLTGTPVHGEKLLIEITDNGTARAITWGTSFEASGNVALPTTTVISTMLSTGFIWNSATSKWRCIGVA